MRRMAKRTVAVLLVIVSTLGCGYAGTYEYKEGVYSREQLYDCAFSIESTYVGDVEFSFE